jgi:Protein of unknown function (DUF1778)
MRVGPRVYAGVIRMRDVLAIRLSDQERRQVAEAAERDGKSLSGFVREAALAASARVTEKVSEADRRDDDGPASVYADRGLVGLERPRHMVDGEWTGRYLD